MIGIVSYFKGKIVSQYSIWIICQIFGNYVPDWKCNDGPPGKDCKEYAWDNLFEIKWYWYNCSRCNGKVTWVEPVFNSAAME